MDAKNEIEKIIISVVSKLVEGDFQSLVKSKTESRITSDEIRELVKDYPGSITMPPDRAFEKIDIYRVKASKIPMWSVDFDLWYDGVASDNTLQCTITFENGKWDYIIDDIHVL